MAFSDTSLLFRYSSCINVVIQIRDLLLKLFDLFAHAIDVGIGLLDALIQCVDLLNYIIECHVCAVYAR